MTNFQFTSSTQDMQGEETSSESENTEQAQTHEQESEEKPYWTKKSAKDRIYELLRENKELKASQTELKLKFLESENARLKNEKRMAIEEGDASKVDAIEEQMVDNRLEMKFAKHVPADQPVSDESGIRDYFIDKFNWFDQNKQMTQAAIELDQQYLNDPKWKNVPWEARLDLVGQTIENKFNNRRAAPMSAGVSNTAPSNSGIKVSQAEIESHRKFRPDLTDDQIKERIVKYKKSLMGKGA